MWPTKQPVKIAPEDGRLQACLASHIKAVVTRQSLNASRLPPKPALPTTVQPAKHPAPSNTSPAPATLVPRLCVGTHIEIAWKRFANLRQNKLALPRRAWERDKNKLLKKGQPFLTNSNIYKLEKLQNKVKDSVIESQ